MKLRPPLFRPGDAVASTDGYSRDWNARGLVLSYVRGHVFELRIDLVAHSGAARLGERPPMGVVRCADFLFRRACERHPRCMLQDSHAGTCRLGLEA